jgi:hypothetical protein
VIVEAADLLDVERSRHAALAGLKDADRIDRWTIRVKEMWVRLRLVGARILIDESDLLANVDPYFLLIEGATREDGDHRRAGVATG